MSINKNFKNTQFYNPTMTAMDLLSKSTYDI